MLGKHFAHFCQSTFLRYCNQPVRLSCSSPWVRWTSLHQKKDSELVVLGWKELEHDMSGSDGIADEIAQPKVWFKKVLFEMKSAPCVRKRLERLHNVGLKMKREALASSLQRPHFYEQVVWVPDFPEHSTWIWITTSYHLFSCNTSITITIAHT